MSTAESLTQSLREHLQLCHNTLAVIGREHQALRDPATAGSTHLLSEKKDLLSRLVESLNRLRQHRIEWTRLSPAERTRHPDVATLLRQNQDVIMRIVMLDRENEQALLRRGLLPPTHLPPSQQQRPLYVANLYQDRMPK